MDTNLLFTMALGLKAPWEVVNLQFDEAAHRLDILIDFTRGAAFPCPVCGSPARSTTQWRRPGGTWTSSNMRPT